MNLLQPKGDWVYPEGLYASDITQLPILEPVITQFAQFFSRLHPWISQAFSPDSREVLRYAYV